MAARKQRSRRNGNSPLDLYAETAARYVISEPTRIYLERIVGEAVKQDLEDPAFRAELREAGKRAYEAAKADLLRKS